MILAGIVLSGSFSGVMTFILFYLLEWAFQYLNKEAIKKKTAAGDNLSDGIFSGRNICVSVHF